MLGSSGAGRRQLRLATLLAICAQYRTCDGRPRTRQPTPELAYEFDLRIALVVPGNLGNDIVQVATGRSFGGTTNAQAIPNR
jgi:hypothetical protein